MIRLFIIADDLTGAIDSGAVFAARGASVRVARSVSDLPEAISSLADVVVVATGTRDGSEHSARQRLAEVRAMLGRRSGIIFKKIDSRLKGHIAAELEVLLMDRRDPVIACPAIPALGRFCLNGAVTGAGVDLPIPVAPALGNNAKVMNATSDTDLDAGLPDDPGAYVFVGAAGLAAALARRLWPGSPVPPLKRHLPVPALIAVGSRDPITMAQVACLKDVAVHDAPNGHVPPLPRHPLRLVRMTQGERRVDPQEAGACFAAQIARALRSAPAATLVVCGGESANGIVGALGIGQLDLCGELLPGVPCHADGRMENRWKSLQNPVVSGRPTRL